MDGETPVQAATAFQDVSLDDLSTADPLKQIPALHKLLFEQFNGKECSHYLETLHKHCLVLTGVANKEVRSLVYAAIKGMTLTSDQWSKLVPFILNDLNGADFDAKISAIKLFEQMPTNLIIEFFNSGVDLLALGRSMPKSANPTAVETDHHVMLRCAALQSISTLLLYRTDGLLSMKSFCLAGWSLLSDRILYDPSRRVFKCAVESVSTLCGVLYRNTRHRMNNAGMPSSSRQTSSNENPLDTFSDPGMPSRPSVWQNSDPEVAPLTPTTEAATYAAIGSFSAASSANLSLVTKAVSSLEKYGHVVFVKILPHIYSFVSRCRAIEACDLAPAILLLSCLLEQLEPLTGEHSNIQVHFMTSPKHLIGEVVETFLFPLLHSKDESLVFEAASNLIFIAQTASPVNPEWVLAACRAVTGLLSRDSARSVIKRVLPILVSSLRLLSPGVLLPVIILVLQHMYKLQLSSAQRLPTFFKLMQIPIQLCNNGSLKPVSFFSSFFKHPWIVSIISNIEENHFREDLMATVMKSFKAHWTSLVYADQEASVLETRLNAKIHRHDSDSDSSSTVASNSQSTKASKRLSATFLPNANNSIFSTLHSSNNLSNSLLGSSTEAISPRPGASLSASAAQQKHAAALSSAKKLRDWREVLYLTVVHLTKVLQWRTHVRTYCYTIFLSMVDAVGQSLSRSKSSRPQLRDLLTRVLEGSHSLKSDAVALRFHYVIMKHAIDIGNTKLVEALFKSTQQRFLGFLDTVSNNTTERSLGYRVDRLHKTNLNNADLEILTILLHMLSKHPAIADSIADEEKGGSPMPNPRLAAALHYIDSISKYKKDDPVSVHRYSKLDQIPTSHNLSHLLASLSTKNGQGPQSPNGPSSFDRTSSPTSARDGKEKEAKESDDSSTQKKPKKPRSATESGSTLALSTSLTIAVPSPSNSPKPSLSGPNIPIAFEGAKTYVPPIEFLSKEVTEKHPDDDFMINYSKSRWPPFSAIDAVRQLDRPITLTSPSDPFIVEAYHIVNIEYARITFYLRITNLTNFQVPKVMLFVDTKGRLEPFNATVETHTLFNKVEASETVLWHTAFKLNSTHVNELMVRLVLLPNAEKLSPSFDIQCMPYRINMHVMILPWIIAYSDYLRELSRYVNTTSFKVSLDRSITLQQLDESLSSSYYRQMGWSYNDTYQLAYSGITWWDERLLFSIFAQRDDDESPYILRFEFRTSTSSLGSIIDANKDDWLRDLLPLFPNWFSFPSEQIEPSDSGFFGFSQDSHKPKPELSTTSLDEKLMLDQWSKSRAS